MLTVFKEYGEVPEEEAGSKDDGTTVVIAKGDLEGWVFEMTRGAVMTGPFAGMKMLREQRWSDGALSPMLLGCHEQELHGPIEAEIERLSMLRCAPRIVNVGCAEGYYAVGMALRLPRAAVWAIDTDDGALDIARRTAALNGVQLRIGEPLDEALAAPHLVIMDCEGGEFGYLDPAKFPGLLRAHIIVEVHNKHDFNMAGILLERWRHFHHIVAYQEVGRDPNLYPFLRPARSVIRWLAVCENRPCQMGWFVMRPKSMARRIAGATRSRMARWWRERP